MRADGLADRDVRLRAAGGWPERDCPQCAASLSPYYREDGDLLEGWVCEDCGHEEDPQGRVVEFSKWDDGRRRVFPENLVRGGKYRVADRDGNYVPGVYQGQSVSGGVYRVFLLGAFTCMVPDAAIDDCVEISELWEEVC